VINCPGKPLLTEKYDQRIFYFSSDFFIREVLKFEVKSKSLNSLIFEKYLKKYFFTIDLTFSIIVISPQIFSTSRMKKSEDK
jgi:hypothetical protein